MIRAIELPPGRYFVCNVDGMLHLLFEDICDSIVDVIAKEVDIEFCFWGLCKRRMVS